MTMDLQNIFYLTATIFFIFSIVSVIYLVFLMLRIKRYAEEISHKAKVTTENLVLAGNSFKAGVLRMFLNFLGSKGGEKNE